MTLIQQAHRAKFERAVPPAGHREDIIQGTRGEDNKIFARRPRGLVIRSLIRRLEIKIRCENGTCRMRKRRAD